MSTLTFRQDWFSNVRGDLLAGVVVALALIPEAIAFSIIAGVDPKVGLYASFCIAVVISIAGGRDPAHHLSVRCDAHRRWLARVDDDGVHRGRAHRYAQRQAAGVLLLVMVVFLGDLVARIPMAALVAVMVMVSIGTFNWESLRNLRTHPRSSSLVMITTVIVVVATHDLAKGVLAGVLLSGVFFAHKVGRVLHVGSALESDGRLRTYTVVGQVFFASADAFIATFDFKEVLPAVCIDVSRAHFWDITAISALDKVVVKFRREGTAVEILGLDEASATLVDRFAVHDKPDAIERLMAH